MVAAANQTIIRFYNEWQDQRGQHRPHYSALYKALAELGPEGLASRWSRAGRQLNIEAVTFYLDPGSFRNMPTDFLPRVIPLEH